MIEIIWGLKTDALFDVWSLEHILSGISCGATAMTVNKKSIGVLVKNVCDKIVTQDTKNAIVFKHDVIVVLFLAYFWETIEHYLETGLAGEAVEYWFQGVEMWANRIIADPLMLVLGYLIAKRWSTLVWPARVLSMVWLFMHIFIFPHSMYLHELFDI